MEITAQYRNDDRKLIKHVLHIVKPDHSYPSTSAAGKCIFTKTYTAHLIILFHKKKYYMSKWGSWLYLLFKITVYSFKD
jgi:hypothetical protein